MPLVLSDYMPTAEDICCNNSHITIVIEGYFWQQIK